MPFFDFLEIGTSDFDTEIEKSDNSRIGMSIEPIKYYLDKLPERDNVLKVNCAISDTNGECEIYYVNNQNIEKYNMPWWIKGSNSIDDYHPLVCKYLIKKNLNPQKLINKYKVQKKTLITIIHEHNISGIFYLKIDTEGHDHFILNKFLNDNNDTNLLPHNIRFESNRLTPNKMTIYNLIRRLQKLGYDLISTSRKADTILKLNLKKVKKNKVFTEELHNYYLDYDLKNKTQSIFNNINDAKKYCIKTNGSGIVIENNTYIVCNNDYLVEKQKSVCYLYL